MNLHNDVSKEIHTKNRFLKMLFILQYDQMEHIFLEWEDYKRKEALLQNCHLYIPLNLSKSSVKIFNYRMQLWKISE